MDTTDAFKCLSAADGKLLWTYRYPALGELDFGNSPRATPLVFGDHVVVHGALGHLACLTIADGKPVWEIDLRDQFKAADERKWGTCSSPLIVDGKLIVNPGGEKASLVALEPLTGKVVWQTPGMPASYGSFMAGTFGGVLQVIGYDADSLGGWDVKTGKRLWRLPPEAESKFNVPTPIADGEHLLVSLENNGTRRYGFQKDGTLNPKALAEHRDLGPDSHTPVLVGNRLFGIWREGYCLDRATLKEVWMSEDKAFSQYGAFVATDERVLAITLESELILLDAKATKFAPLGRVKVFEDEGGLYSHPAFVGTRMYVRGGSSIVCVDLKEK